MTLSYEEAQSIIREYQKMPPLGIKSMTQKVIRAQCFLEGVEAERKRCAEIARNMNSHGVFIADEILKGEASESK